MTEAVTEPKRRRQGGKGRPLDPERARALANARWADQARVQEDGQRPQEPGRPSRASALERRRQVRDAVLLEDGRRLGDAMDAWQREDFEALDDPQSRHAYLERPRGHSKTGDVGTEAVVELLAGAPGQRLFAFGADEDQARILFDDVCGKLGRMGRVARGKTLTRGQVRVLKRAIVSWTGSVLTVMPADVPGSWGLRPDWVACDELTEWRYEALWQSIWSASGKRPRCRILVISTAGFDKSHFAWQVRETAAREANWYFSSRGQCASWIDPAWLAQQERTLPPHVFQRLHQNRWVDGVGAFLTAAEVDAVFSDDLPAVSGARVSVGLDVGLTKDRSVLAPVAETKDKLLVVLGLETWAGSKGAKVDLREVEDAAAAVARKFSAPIYVDPWQAILMAQNLQRRGRRVHEVPITSESRRRLFGYLLTAIRDGRLRCRPHAELRRELLGLEVKETLAGFRVDHKPGRHDDHAFAVALALSGLMTQGEGFTLVWSETETSAQRAEAFWQHRAHPNTRYVPAPPPGSPSPPPAVITCRAHGVDVMNDAHRAECREARRKFATRPEVAAPTLVDADRGLHRVSTPSGASEVYVDPRGLSQEPREPHVQCEGCGARYSESFHAQHLVASPRCRVAPVAYAEWRDEGWVIARTEDLTRVHFHHEPCGFSGHTTRAGLQALHDRHMAERHAPRDGTWTTAD